MLQCPECPKYKTCTELCEEAEAYVNQDYASIGKGGVMLQNGDPSKEAFNSSGSNEWIDMIKVWQGINDMPEAPVDMEDIEEMITGVLTERQMQAIVDFYVHGMTSYQIGEKYGISRQAVNQRIIWGAKRLKRVVEGKRYWKRKIVPALNTLTERQSQVALLVFHEGLSYEEVGEVLDCHKYTISRHVTEIKRKIGDVDLGTRFRVG